MTPTDQAQYLAEQKFALMLTAMTGWETDEQDSMAGDWWCERAPEPEPPYDGPEQPEDWDEEDFPHYDTPGGW